MNKQVLLALPLTIEMNHPMIEKERDVVASGQRERGTGISRVLDDSPRIDTGCASLTESYRLARAHRGGGDLFTRQVNDPLGSWVAAVAIRFDIHPTIVTLTDLMLALLASTLVIAQAEHLRAGWLPGLLALVLWQLSYILDCADGQVARATGKKSDFGARVDVLVDFLVHAAVICALITVLTERVELPAALLAAFAMLWPVNLLIGVLARSDGNVGHSFSRRGGIITVIKLVRDTGFILFVMGMWLLVTPQTIVVPIVAITVINASFLLASIGREAYLSMRLT